ncbi:hypothetical protein K432DRAFT_304029 [Lepidopterella palustris CBS 459.81]|uniref:BAH domain-containing protein n=1 Tax=Lepidopterella palustris CBS 459.81 TaxID=1314670 RepID=A0A8E2E560_9PEZI|nr:hypothetical protein K432DRAFT_304029 [Lepidopterella palustris CBS 459.81]
MFDGFKIQYYQSLLERPKKRKRDQDSALILQENPFDRNLDTIFSVSPADYWEDTSRYRKFTIANETFAVNDIVFIRSSDEDDPGPDAPIKGWVARVLEVRAGDEQHVYLRIYWLYRPEDLPGGRKPYHGRNELIASNDMQIVDATTVNAKANVKHWVEEDDKSELMDGDQLFWRQTYNIRPKNNETPLSLPKHCIDQVPCNPDRLLIQCSNPKCKKWLHAVCIESAAVKEAYAAYGLTYPTNASHTPPAPMNGTTSNTNLQRSTSTNKKGRKKKNSNAEPDAEVNAQQILLFKAEVVNGSEMERTKTKLVLTDLREGQGQRTWEVVIKCLICGEDIEEEEEGDRKEEEHVHGAEQGVKEEEDEVPKTEQAEEEEEDRNLPFRSSVIGM